MSLLQKGGEETFLLQAQKIAGSQPLYSWLGARIVLVREVHQTIRARGRALHRGRSTAVVEGEVYDESGDLVAKALGTIAILRHQS